MRVTCKNASPSTRRLASIITRAHYMHKERSRAQAANLPRPRLGRCCWRRTQGGAMDRGVNVVLQRVAECSRPCGRAVHSAVGSVLLFSMRRAREPSRSVCSDCRNSIPLRATVAATCLYGTRDPARDR